MFISSLPMMTTPMLAQGACGNSFTFDQLETIVQHGARTQSLRAADLIVHHLAIALRESGQTVLAVECFDIYKGIQNAVAGHSVDSKADCLQDANDFCADLLQNASALSQVSNDDEAMADLGTSRPLGQLLRQIAQFSPIPTR